MYICLNYAIKLKTDFILFQEPFIIRNNIIIISHFAFYYIILFTQHVRLRVIIFTRK